MYNMYIFVQMLEFFKNNSDAGAGELPRKKALDIVQKNIYWANNQKNNLLDILKSAKTIG
jgi:hypothetical protein